LFLPGPIHRVLAQSLLFKTRGAGEGSLPSLHSPPVARARTNRKRPAKNEDLVRLQVADAPPAPGWRCDGCAGRRRSRSTQRHLAAGVKKERARETGSRGWARPPPPPPEDSLPLHPMAVVVDRHIKPGEDPTAADQRPRGSLVW
ncbi:unnamed protein product, partial [Prorocentrum cordatum]